MQLACTLTFEAVHGASCDQGINHPNQYYNDSKALLESEVYFEIRNNAQCLLITWYTNSSEMHSTTEFQYIGRHFLNFHNFTIFLNDDILTALLVVQRSSRRINDPLVMRSPIPRTKQLQMFHLPTMLNTSYFTFVLLKCSMPLQCTIESNSSQSSLTLGETLLRCDMIL